MTTTLFLGYLCLVWIATVILGALLGGMAAGIVVRRTSAELQPGAHALVAAETREIARRARQYAAQLGAGVALILAVVLRLTRRSDGLDVLALVPVGLGALLAVPLCVSWLQRDLTAYFRSSGHTTQAGSRPRAARSPDD